MHLHERISRGCTSSHSPILCMHADEYIGVSFLPPTVNLLLREILTCAHMSTESSSKFIRDSRCALHCCPKIRKKLLFPRLRDGRSSERYERAEADFCPSSNLNGDASTVTDAFFGFGLRLLVVCRKNNYETRLAYRA